MKNNDKYFMKLAIKEAKKAGNDVFPNPKGWLLDCQRWKSCL